MTRRDYLLRLFRAVLIPFVVGWLVALAAGIGLARLQYAEVSTYFSPDKVTAEYESRLDRELREGPLLLLAQIGVMAGVLVWQVGELARGVDYPLRFGAVSGAVLAVIQGVIAVLMHVPWTFLIPLMIVLLGAGLFAGWSAAPVVAEPTPPTEARDTEA